MDVLLQKSVEKVYGVEAKTRVKHVHSRVDFGQHLTSMIYYSNMIHDVFWAT